MNHPAESTGWQLPVPEEHGYAEKCQVHESISYSMPRILLGEDYELL